MLWMAPELLRMRDRPAKGTRLGDIYSFAIILQEILFRSMPFFLDNTSPKGKFFKIFIYQQRNDVCFHIEWFPIPCRIVGL